MMNVDTQVPAIIVGDFLSAYGVIRGLAKNNVPLYAVSTKGTGLALGSRYIQGSVVLDPSSSDFISDLNQWSEQNVGSRAVIVVAGEDECLEVLSKNLESLREGLEVTFPDWASVKLVREKKCTYELAQELGIPVPVTHYITNQSELETILESQHCYPLFMKAENSSALLSKFGVKGAVCVNREEVLENYTKYEGFGGELLLQEMLPGDREIIKTVLLSLNKNSEPTGLLINEKKRSGGKFMGGVLVESSWDDTLLDYSLRLVRRIGYVGYAGVQFKYDERDNDFKLLEINGRVSMSNSLALRCGVNLPYLMYQEALQGPLPKITNFEQNYKNRMLWWYPAGDVIAIYRDQLYLEPIAYLKSIIGRGYTIEPFSFKDPYPGWLSIKNLFQEIARKVFRI